MIATLHPPMAPPWPLHVTQPFGHPGPLPPHAPHTGLDLAAEVGRPILAVGDGVVVHYFRDGHPDGPAADGNAVCVLLDGGTRRCWVIPRMSAPSLRHGVPARCADEGGFHAGSRLRSGSLAGLLA